MSIILLLEKIGQKAILFTPVIPVDDLGNLINSTENVKKENSEFIEKDGRYNNRIE